MDKKGILDILSSITSEEKTINIKDLPTQGYFYPSDFRIKIKKASKEDILEYNYNYIKDNLGVILYEIYKIVEKNTSIIGYSYNDIKRNDIIYVFFEIVKFTTNKDILIPLDEYLGAETSIKLNNKTFNYFDYESLGCEYSEKTREFLKHGYRFSMHSIGVENCVIDYIYKKEMEGINTENYTYDFLFFLGNKSYLTDDEIENLITIFNFELDSKEIKKVSDIVGIMASAIPNTVKLGNKIVSIDLNIDFEHLFA